MKTSKGTRTIQLIGAPAGGDAAMVTQLTWRETLGRSFEGSLRLISPGAPLDKSAWLGAKVGIQIGGNGPARHGHIQAWSSQGWVVDEGGYAHTAQLCSWDGLLRLVGGHSVFQDKTVIEIARAVFKRRKFCGDVLFQTNTEYPKRTYTVQHDESDHDFIRRLFEEEGLYTFYDYKTDGHTLVICDAPPAGTEVSDAYVFRDAGDAYAARSVYGVQFRDAVATQTHQLGDYDFTKPRAAMAASGLTSAPAADAADWSWYRYPGRYEDPTVGNRLARVRAEAIDADRGRVEIKTEADDFAAGSKIAITADEGNPIAGDWLVTATQWTATEPAGGVSKGDSGGFQFECHATLLDWKTPFRAAQTTPRPRPAGPQIGTVTAPSAAEVWTDKFGRIRVKFAWYREAQPGEDSSCWIRVLQLWTGKGWGGVSLPRVGEEVIVDFIDGDIDRPIVIGRVFNADRMPPDDLPAAHTRTIFRTRSTPVGGADEGHELTFEDLKDHESIYFHSQKDFSRVVEDCDELKVGFGDGATGNQTSAIYNDQTLQIGVGSGGGKQTLTIGGGRVTEIKTGDDSLKVAGGSLSIQAATSITLKCGGSSIELTPSGIEIKSAQVTIAGDGKVAISGTEIKAAAGAELELTAGAIAKLSGGGPTQIKGAIVMIN